MRKYAKIWYSRTGHRWQYGAYILYAGYLRLQTQTQNMYYSLLFHCNNVWTSAPQSYVTRTLPALLYLVTITFFMYYNQRYRLQCCECWQNIILGLLMSFRLNSLEGEMVIWHGINEINSRLTRIFWFLLLVLKRMKCAVLLAHVFCFTW